MKLNNSTARNAIGKKRIALLAVLLFISTVSSSILVSEFGILSDKVTVEQAIVVDGKKGSASLEAGLPDKNIVGTGNSTKSWSMAVNANGTISTTVSIAGNDSDSVNDHFTSNISNNNGMALIIDENLVSSDNDKTIDLSSGSTSVNLVGPTEKVSDGVRLKTRFPINYNASGLATGNDLSFEIRIDADGASLS